MHRATHFLGTTRGITLLAVIVLMIIGAMRSVALGDPLPGEIRKFSQRPLDGLVPIPGGPTYWGHDEVSTALRTANTAPYQGNFMADDFADKFSTPVVHVSWWGSYLDQQQFAGVKKFLISFETDVPASPTGGFSHPGTPILSQVVTRGALAPTSGTFTEALISPGGPPLLEKLYQYNAELKFPFPQQANTVYWIKIAALVDVPTDGNIRWGWHDRDYRLFDPLASTPPLVSPGERDIGAGTPFSPVWHFQDDAVSGLMTTLVSPDNLVLSLEQSGYAPEHYLDFIDGPQGIGQFSKDLAFELYTIPEPTIALLAMGGMLFLRRHRR